VLEIDAHTQYECETKSVRVCCKMKHWFSGPGVGTPIESRIAPTLVGNWDSTVPTAVLNRTHVECIIAGANGHATVDTGCTSTGMPTSHMVAGDR